MAHGWGQGRRVVAGSWDLPGYTAAMHRSWTCACCGQIFAGLPLDVGVGQAPAPYEDLTDAERAQATLTSDFCVIEHPAQPRLFGWLSSRIFGCTPTTLNLKTRLTFRPGNQRPSVELEPTDHPLAVEQREGISVSRVQEIVGPLLHRMGAATADGPS